MDINYFNLFDGSLEFHNDKLVIYDKAKRDRVLLLINLSCGLVYSIATMLRGIREKDNGFALFGLSLTVCWVGISIFRYKEFQKVENTILLSDVQEVKFSFDKFSSSIIAKFMTKNGRQRKIKLVQEDNQDFVFKNLLVSHNIPNA